MPAINTNNTHYSTQLVGDGAEPTGTAASPPGIAALSNIANHDHDVGQASNAPKESSSKGSFKLPPPNGNGGAGNLGATEQRIANLSNSIQADIYAFMALFFQMALETRKTSSEIRSAEREARFQELQNAADKIREAGVFQMVAGIVGGVATIGAGALNMAGGLKSGLTLADKKLDPQAATALSQAIGAKFGGVASGVQGVGQIGGAGLNFGASVAQTKQKEHETQAEKDQAQVDMASELYQNMQQTIQEVLSKLAAMQQSNSDTAKQIVRA